MYLLVRMAQRWQVAVPTIPFAYGILKQVKTFARLRGMKVGLSASLLVRMAQRWQVVLITSFAYGM